MKTHFASPERTTKETLWTEIELVSSNPLVTGLLASISGLLAVLDEFRQIVAFNASFMQMLGVEDSEALLGLRPGEALQCEHADAEPAGCGTTKFCSTCGAAIAIVSSLGQDEPVERLCVLKAKRGKQSIDIVFLVRSQPIEIGKKRFLLLFLQDVTKEQQRASLERVFFHDINNMLTILSSASELLEYKSPSQLSKNIRKVSVQLQQEVSIQRCLLENDACSYRPIQEEISLERVLSELQNFFNNHPVGYNKEIIYQGFDSNISFLTDLSLLLRVLRNMIINALEATEDHGFIKLWIDYNHSWLSFSVWNKQPMPEEVAHRVFQKNFSTKKEEGRGIGTFSMKLFGEKILKGDVRFSSSIDEGTLFTFSLPLDEGSKSWT